MDLKEATGRIARQGELVEKIRAEVAKVIVGQEKLVDRLILAMATGGHILLEGVPGLAKTLSVNTLAKALGLEFRRISFTPDLLPADVVGTLVYSPKTGEFTPKKGPVFTNLLHIDGQVVSNVLYFSGIVGVEVVGNFKYDLFELLQELVGHLREIDNEIQGILYFVCYTSREHSQRSEFLLLLV